LLLAQIAALLPLEMGMLAVVENGEIGLVFSTVLYQRVFPASLTAACYAVPLVITRISASFIAISNAVSLVITHINAVSFPISEDLSDNELDQSFIELY